MHSEVRADQLSSSEYLHAPRKMTMNCLFYRRFFKSTKSICIRTWYRKNFCDVLEERAYPFLLLDGGWKISEKWTRTRDMMTSKLRIHECESMYVYYCVCFCVPLVRSIGSLFLFLSLFFCSFVAASPSS